MVQYILAGSQREFQHQLYQIDSPLVQDNTTSNDLWRATIPSLADLISLYKCSSFKYGAHILVNDYMNFQ